MNKELKRQLISAGVTFFAGFAIVVAPELDNITMDGLSDGALVGLLLTGVRTGLKMLLESFLLWYNNR